MSQLILLTNSRQSSAEVLPALALLGHHVRVFSAEPSALLETPPVDALLVDGRTDLVAVRGLCRVIRSTGVNVPVVLIATEGGLVGVNSEWGVDDFVLDTVGPAELDARLRLAVHRMMVEADTEFDEIRSGVLVVDENSYTAKLRNRTLDLTYKEFELLKYLAQHPGRVFTRAQLLQEVWGYDYYGGTRTVDVHVRRLRAKMGPEYEHLIGTVRNVGYRFIASQEQEAMAEQ
jgi:DNA-binding response OmpR family regulator